MALLAVAIVVWVGLPMDALADGSAGQIGVDPAPSADWWKDLNLWVVILSGLTVLVGAGQLALFWLQLSSMSQSIDDAAKAAQAAEHTAQAAIDSAANARAALEHSKLVADAEIRPWLTLSLDIAKDVVFNEGAKGQCQVSLQLQVKNVGKSPALAVTTRAVGWALNRKFQISNFEKADQLHLPYKKMLEETRGIQMGNAILPGENDFTATCQFALTKDEIDRAISKSTTPLIHIYGSLRVYYRFGPQLCITEKEFVIRRRIADVNNREFGDDAIDPSQRLFTRDMLDMHIWRGSAI
jgi:flagellar basal body-associated protein FliL